MTTSTFLVNSMSMNATKYKKLNYQLKLKFQKSFKAVLLLGSFHNKAAQNIPIDSDYAS